MGECEAEDLTQSVMLKVSEALHDFRGDSSVSTWIYRIATNAALDKLRGKSIQAVSDAELESDNGEVPPDAQTASVETAAIREEMNACIREFIERLPETLKTVIVLSELEGFKNAEIAAILGISLDTVKIRLHRAREKLRDELDTGCSFYRDERVERTPGERASGTRDQRRRRTTKGRAAKVGRCGRPLFKCRGYPRQRARHRSRPSGSRPP